MALLSRTFFRKRAISLATTITLSAFTVANGPIRASHADEMVAGHMTVTEPNISDEAPFLAKNDAAMNKMMAAMAVKPTGDVDHDFVEMMVPHHQGAIDMAQAVLRHGHNEQIRRLAQEIIVTQQQEIAAMRLALGEPLPPSVAAPTQPQVTPASGPGATSHDSTSHDSKNMK
jgi:uncharacterized protein (DUF305 family)